MAEDLQGMAKYLLTTARGLRPLTYLQPTNGEAQKQAFLAGTLAEPSFEYVAELSYDAPALQSRLMAMAFPQNPLGRLLRDKAREQIIWNRLVQARGRPEALQLSRALFGAPKPRLVARARAILRDLPPFGAEKGRILDQAAFMAGLRACLKAEGLKGWKVVPLPREGATNVVPAKRQIQVANRPRFSELELRRLSVHEVGVHALRAANGFTQDLRIFGVGLAGYQSTEEGLAVFCELRSGTCESAVLKKYAARVLAVDAVARGLGFRETFDVLRGEGVGADRAWTCSLRAHRGGGLLKDQVYLKGLFEILAFRRRGGKVEELFLGKIGIGELELLRPLLEGGELHPARYLPSHLKEAPRFDERAMAFLEAI